MSAVSHDAREAAHVGLVGAVGEVDAAHLGVEGAPEILAAVVLLDVLLGLLAHRDAGRLEDLDLDDLGVPARDAHVHAALGVAALDLEAVDRRRAHAQVAHVDAGRVEAGDDGPLDDPRGRVRVAAGDHLGALGQRGAVGQRQLEAELGGDVDVDQADDTVLAEELGRAARLPDDARVDLGARLDRLEGVDLDVGADVGLLADHALVADGRALAQGGARLHVAVLADDRPVDLGARADVGVGVDHAEARLGVVFDHDVAAQHRVGADARVGVDLGVVADHGRPGHVLERLDADVLADVDVVLEPDARDRGRDLAVEHVAVGGEVLAEAADVLPVPLGDRAVERLAELEQLGEQLLAEVVGLAGRDVVEDLGLEHVDAGVDGVREDLAPGRLLEEPLDPALVVDHDHAEVERVLDVLQDDGGHGAAALVLGDHRGQVEVGQRVARDHDEALAEQLLGVLDAARRAEGHLLDRVVDVHPEGAAVAEVVADGLGQEGERDHDVLDAVQPEQLDDVLHAGLVGDRHHRLGLVARERAQARALSPGHHDGAHGPPPRCVEGVGLWGARHGLIVPEAHGASR